jgi:hypothetical protein
MLLSVIYDNKENIVQMPDIERHHHQHHHHRKNGEGRVVRGGAPEHCQVSSKEKGWGDSKHSPTSRCEHSNKAKSTAIMNRTVNGYSKSSEKFLEMAEGGRFSSFRKSEPSNIVNQSLGSLIFETPPKGKENRSYPSLKMEEVNRFFEGRIEISPTPHKDEEELPHESVDNDYVSPSKFLITKSAYKNI